MCFGGDGFFWNLEFPQRIYVLFYGRRHPTMKAQKFPVTYQSYRWDSMVKGDFAINSCFRAWNFGGFLGFQNHHHSGDDQVTKQQVGLVAMNSWPPSRWTFPLRWLVICVDIKMGPKINKWPYKLQIKMRISLRFWKHPKDMFIVYNMYNRFFRPAPDPSHLKSHLATHLPTCPTSRSTGLQAWPAPGKPCSYWSREGIVELAHHQTYYWTAAWNEHTARQTSTGGINAWCGGFFVCFFCGRNMKL